MSKERTTLRDLAVALHCALRLQGWALCPTCGQVMLATLADAYRVPRWAQALPVAVAQFSHIVADADGGDEGALECGTCNRKRGRARWVPTRWVRIVRKGDARAGRAYREAHAARTAAERQRALPLI
jgi:hypothetical protein